MRFLDAKIHAVLPELLPHIAGVPPGPTVNFHVRQPRHKRRNADLGPVKAGLLDLRKFLFRLTKHLLGRRKAVQSLALRNLLRPAHVRRERTVPRLRHVQCGHIVG